MKSNSLSDSSLHTARDFASNTASDAGVAGSSSMGDEVQTRQLLATVRTTFENLTIHNMDSVRSIYSHDVEFIDPLARIEGIDNLVAYFSSHYENLTSCKFEYDNELIKHDRANLEWKMSFRHPKLSRGEQIFVDGMSVFEFKQGRVSFHRDYYDGGAMIYQHVPVLRTAIKFIRGRLS